MSSRDISARDAAITRAAEDLKAALEARAALDGQKVQSVVICSIASADSHEAEGDTIEADVYALRKGCKCPGCLEGTLKGVVGAFGAKVEIDHGDDEDTRAVVH